MLDSSTRYCTVFLVAMTGASLAHAQKSPASLTDCRAIADSANRLACYDALAARDDAKAAVATPAAVTAAAATSAGQVPAGEERKTVASAPPASTSILDAAWGFNPDSEPYQIGFYRSNYLLAARYSDNVNRAPFSPLAKAFGQPDFDLNNTEAKFQLSFKARLWTTDDRRWGVWAAYTQQSQWQIYNGNESRPFRDTNYMPELFVSYRPDVDLGAGFNWKLLNVGYNHQSNGRSDILSRSWDRLFATFGVEKENLALMGTVWYRIPEDQNQDDNPDITDYYGYGELSALYRWRGNSFSVSGRGNIAKGKGAVQAGWFSPPLLGPLRGYVQVFSGYGESLIDYNWKQTTVGAGIALSDGL